MRLKKPVEEYLLITAVMASVVFVAIAAVGVYLVQIHP